MLEKFLPAVIATIPVILAPIVAWIASRVGSTGAVRRSEYLRNRAETLSHMGATIEALDDSTANQVRVAIRDELTSLLEELRRDEDERTPKVAPRIGELSFLRRVFILYKPASVVGWVVHGLYYYLLIGFVSFPIQVWIMGPVPFPVWYLIIIWLLIIVLAYLARLWAIRLHRRSTIVADSSRMEVLSNDKMQRTR